jgi:hypothetical protein
MADELLATGFTGGESMMAVTNTVRLATKEGVK